VQEVYQPTQQEDVQQRVLYDTQLLFIDECHKLVGKDRLTATRYKGGNLEREPSASTRGVRYSRQLVRNAVLEGD
jgi:hypothetical protein